MTYINPSLKLVIARLLQSAPAPNALDVAIPGAAQPGDYTTVPRAPI